jgi:hypothetical protein
VVRLTFGLAVLATFVLAPWSGPAFGQEVILTQVSDTAVEGVGQAGEPWVVADPRDPQTIVVIWLETGGATNPEDIPNIVTGPENCGIGRSTDGGQTWSVRSAPYQSSTIPGSLDLLSICGDPTAGVLPDGTIVLTAVELGSPDWVQSISSYDGGATWTAPTVPFGVNPAIAAAQANQSVPDMGAGRQWTTVDPITGEIAIQSQVDAPTTGRHMTVSSDRGASWSVPRNTGSTSLGPIGSAYGVIAGVYTSGQDRIFQTTTNHGLTWVRNVMPVGPAAAGLFGGPITAADPTKRGRFAVLLPGSGTLEVWITTDAGRTAARWTRAKVFTAAPGDSFAHPWIAFSPTGALGVRWRSSHADGSFDVDAVVSRDGGATWSAPVGLTADRGPSPPVTNATPGDDCACNLHLTETHLITTWGDSFSGRRETWFGSFDYTTP